MAVLLPDGLSIDPDRMGVGAAEVFRRVYFCFDRASDALGHLRMIRINK